MTDLIRRSAEMFARDVAGHQMAILHEDGLYRHVRFARPNTGMYHFDLITWPGYLTICGDLESYTFRRLDDMFEFFRTKSGWNHDTINPHYWSEKLANGGRDSVRKYDEEIFIQRVKEYVAEAIRYGNAPRGLAKAVREQILEEEDLGSEDVARKLLTEFRFRMIYRASCSCGEADESESYITAMAWERAHYRDSRGGHVVTIRETGGFEFTDVWEMSFSDYDWHFLRACHAIQWGIAQYDKARAAVAA